MYFMVFADVFEEVLEIVSYMTYFSPVISLNMWSLWPLMVDAVQDWAIDYFESKYCDVILDDYLPSLDWLMYVHDFTF